MNNSGVSYRNTKRSLLLSVLVTSANLAESQSYPLYSPPNSPITALLGIPSPRTARVLAPGEVSSELMLSATSHYVRRERSDETLLWDGESWRAAYHLRIGLTESWELQLEMPWIRQHGGRLDGLIDNWHSVWGLPDGGRSTVARDTLDYRYLGPGTAFELSDSESGPGDIQASVHRKLWDSEHATVQWAAGVKLATGRPAAFLGNGAESAHTAIHAQGPLAGAMHWHAQLGYLRSRRSPVLGSTQQLGLWFGGFGLALPLSHSVKLIAQLDAHDAPLDSKLNALGRRALRLTTGLQWQATPRWQLEASVVEDVRVNTAADVGFQLGFRRNH